MTETELDQLPCEHEL